MIRNSLYALLVIWALAYAASFILPAMTEPSGDGFTRGLNRLYLFFGWQIGAGLIALLLWGFSRSADLSKPVAWLFRIPILLTLALFLFVVGVILWAIFSKPPPTDYVPPDVTTSADAIPVPPND